MTLIASAALIYLSMLVKWPAEITIHVMCINSGRAYNRFTRTESVKNKTIIRLGWIVRLNFDKKIW